MSPERQRWLAFVRAAKSDLDAIEEAGLGRLGAHDGIVLTLDEVRDMGALVSIVAHAAVLCDRLAASLGDAEEGR